MSTLASTPDARTKTPARSRDRLHRARRTDPRRRGRPVPRPDRRKPYQPRAGAPRTTVRPADPVPRHRRITSSSWQSHYASPRSRTFRGRASVALRRPRRHPSRRAPNQWGPFRFDANRGQAMGVEEQTDKRRATRRSGGPGHRWGTPPGPRLYRPQ